jgi:hypothetical protein
MRSIIAGASLVVLLVAVGCNHAPQLRDRPPNGGGVVSNTATPTVENLISYLNYNAKLLEPTQAIRCKDVMIDVNAAGQKVGVNGKMLCQTPRNFLLSGVVLGSPAVDIGSNDKEFWFWSRELKTPDNHAYLYHCSYDDLARGTKVPFPFQPEMVVSALGLAQYDPGKTYRLDTTNDRQGHKSILLTEQALSPEHKPIQKITVFDANEATRPGQPQVLAHILKDEQGKVVCAANIRSVQRVGPKGVTIPRMIDFSWPEQKLTMTMRIENPSIIPMLPENAAEIFTRRKLHYPSFDLATQALDGAGVQQTRATAPIYRR